MTSVSTDSGLADRYERLRQAYRQGQVSNEMTLLERQGMPGWMRGWQRMAAAGLAGVDPGRNGSAAENDFTEIARGLRMTEMVSIAAAMISGKFSKERVQ